MTDAKPLLERAAREFEPAPDLFNRTQDRIRKRQRNRRIASASLGLLVAAVGIGVAINAFVGTTRTGPSEQMTDRIAFVRTPSSAIVSGEPSTGPVRVLVVDGKSGQTTELRLEGLSGGGLGPIRWSPDGRRMAFTYKRPEAAFPLVYVADADGSDVHLLTPCVGCGGQRDPDWSPDGRRIAFACTCSRPLAPGLGLRNVRLTEIYVIDADGSNLRRITTCWGATCAWQVWPTWAPDGDHLAFQQRGASDQRDAGLRVVQVSTGAVHTTFSCTSCAGMQPDWSPVDDLIAIAYRGAIQVLTHRNARYTVVACERDGGCKQNLTPAWSPDGRSIAFARLAEDPSAPERGIWVVQADGTGLRQVVRSPDDGLDVAPAWVPSSAQPSDQ